MSEIEIITAEALVDIPVSSGYYKRLRKVLENIINDHKEDLEDAHTQIETQAIKDSWVYDYETLLIFCKAFEDQVRDKGFVKKVSVEDAMKLMGETED